MSSKFSLCLILLVSWCTSAKAAAQSAAKPEFLSFDQAQPALLAATAKLPPDLKASHLLTRDEWANCVRKEGYVCKGKWKQWDAAERWIFEKDGEHRMWYAYWEGHASAISLSHVTHAYPGGSTRCSCRRISV